MSWGAADFLGGHESRRIPASSVGFFSQCAGAGALALVLLVSGQPFAARPALFGLAAGASTGAGLLFFYRGLAIGAMSIVAPVSACGAVLPVTFAFATGDSPGAVAVLGIAAALVGVVIVSIPATDGLAEDHRLSLVLAAAAALAFGMFFVFVDRGTAGAGASPLWVVGGVRVGALATMGVAVLAARAPLPRQRLAAIAAIGLLDTAANAMFAYASTRASLGVVATLASLYPVMTVMLARAVLQERLSGAQPAGVALTLAGVVAISAG